MRRKLGTIILAFFTLSLIGCEKKDSKIIYDTYTVKYADLTYTGYVESVNKKSYTLTDSNELKVSNGELVEKDQPLFTIDISDYQHEEEKINNQINNIYTDIASNENKIKSLKDEITIIDNKMIIYQNNVKKEVLLDEELVDGEKKKNEENNKDIEIESLEYKSEKKLLQEEIESLLEENIQLERQIKELDFELGYIKYKDKEVSPFKGQVIIEEDIITIYSLECEVIYNATQEQTALFSNKKEYILNINNKDVGLATMKYIIPNDDVTERGITSIYKIGFTIDTEENLLRNNIVNIIERSNELSIPYDYVYEDEGKYFVKLNDNEVEVNLIKDKSYYIVISGIKENDILQSYEGKME